MKDGALFINTSRGGVVDEQALIDAVKSKKISGAGLDVVAVEPMEKHEEILDIDNIIITPHSAWAPVETRTRLVEIVKNNIKNGTIFFISENSKNLKELSTTINYIQSRGYKIVTINELLK